MRIKICGGRKEEKKILQTLKIHSASALPPALFHQNQGAEYLSLAAVLSSLSHARREGPKTHFRCFVSNVIFIPGFSVPPVYKQSLSVRETRRVAWCNLWVPFTFRGVRGRRGELFHYDPVTAPVSVVTFWHVYWM